MEIDRAEAILQEVLQNEWREGDQRAQAIAAVLAWNERIGNLYDAREAEVLELLRERNATHRRAQQVRGGLKPYARPVEIVDYLMGEQA